MEFTIQDRIDATKHAIDMSPALNSKQKAVAKVHFQSLINHAKTDDEKKRACLSVTRQLMNKEDRL